MLHRDCREELATTHSRTSGKGRWQYGIDGEDSITVLLS